jgi:hypothetical protein
MQPEIDESVIWSQLEQLRPVHEETKLQQLINAYFASVRYCTLDAPLQHTCSAECNWHRLSDEHYICKQSGNAHICTPKLCKHRAQKQGFQVPLLQLNKEDKLTQEAGVWVKAPESNSICTLTGEIREQVDHNPYEQEPIKPQTKEKKFAGERSKQQDANRLEATRLARQYYGAEFQQTCVLFVVHICLRIWNALHPAAAVLEATTARKCLPVCRFKVCLYFCPLLKKLLQDFCLVIFYDLSVGWSCQVNKGETVRVIPKLATILPANVKLPAIVSTPGLRKSTNNSKAVHTKIIELDATTLRDLADDFASLDVQTT